MPGSLQQQQQLAQSVQSAYSMRSLPASLAVQSRVRRTLEALMSKCVNPRE